MKIPDVSHPIAVTPTGRVQVTFGGQVVKEIAGHLAFCPDRVDSIDVKK